MGRMRTVRWDVPCEDWPTLRSGDKIKFQGEGQRYTVRAVSADGRWAICTKPFNLKHTVLYAIVDFKEAVRGPDDFRGLGYETPEQITNAMAMLEAGEAQVSARSDLRLDIERIDWALPCSTKGCDKPGPFAIWGPEPMPRHCREHLELGGEGTYRYVFDVDELGIERNGRFAVSGVLDGR